MHTRFFGLSILLLTPCLVVWAGPATQPAKRAASLQDALKSAEAKRVAGQVEAAAKVLTEAAEKGLVEVGRESDAGEALGKGLRESKDATDAKAKLAAMQAAVVDAVAAVEFEPLMEAPLPEGFPGPGPVGKVIVKDYPAYREARAKMPEAAWGQNRAFNTLFGHIQSKQIPMSAPVEMSFPKDATTRPTEVTTTTKAEADVPMMAFLYVKPTTGTPGMQGDVEVVDVPAMKVVSIGLRGNGSKEQAKMAREKLAVWLAAHARQYERTGEDRYFGYNSPFVLPNRRFSEVQAPVREKK